MFKFSRVKFNFTKGQHLSLCASHVHPNQINKRLKYVTLCNLLNEYQIFK